MENELKELAILAEHYHTLLQAKPLDSRNALVLCHRGGTGLVKDYKKDTIVYLPHPSPYFRGFKIHFGEVTIDCIGERKVTIPQNADVRYLKLVKTKAEVFLNLFLKPYFEKGGLCSGN